MASKELNVKVKHRYDTASNWTTNNPVLLAGELGIESDTKRMKVGDGSTAWTSLDYTNLTNRIYQDVNIWDLGVGTFIIKPSENNGSLRIYYDYNNKESFFQVKTGTITISRPNTINTWLRYYFANVLLEMVQTTDSLEADVSQVLIHGQFGPNQNIYSITKIDGDSPIAKISDLNDKVNKDASNITDTNSWKTKLGYITGLPSNIAYTDKSNMFSKNQYFDGSLIFNRDNPVCIDAFVGKTGGDLIAPIGSVFKVNNTDGIIEIGGNEMPIQASGLTDGTTTKSMSEILAGGGGIKLRRWTD